MWYFIWYDLWDKVGKGASVTIAGCTGRAPGGPIVRRVIVEFEIVGSNLRRDFFFFTNRQAESARESVSWRNLMQHDEY